jgi:hypothetical protein
MKLRPWIFLFVVGLVQARGQDLPKRSPGDVPDFEPKLMLDGPHSSPAPAPEDGIDQKEAAFRLAEERAADSEQLFKEGILARVEVEARMLRVVQAKKELLEARLTVAAAQADTVKKSFDTHAATQAELDSANTALKTAQENAAEAAADWNKAEIDAATVDLQRKRKLYAEGVGSKREVELAEDRLAMLTGTNGR